LNHDYTEEDEEDEFKVSLFHLIHLFQCNHGSETNQQILNNEELIFRDFLRNTQKISSHLKMLNSRIKHQAYAYKTVHSIF